MRAFLFPLALLLTLTSAAPSRAQVIVPPPRMDEVVLNLAVEDWVKTDTARVVVVVDAAADGGDGGSARGDVLKAASTLADRADWKVVRFDRSQDAAGLDRWTAVLEARLPETQLGGLAERAKKASRPGLQLRVDAVEFTPTLAEVEALRTRLRTDIYRRVAEEVKAVDQAFGRSFRVAGVTFGVDQPPVPVPMHQRSEAMTMDAKVAAPMNGPVMVSEKLTLTARVVLQAVAPGAPAAAAP